MPRLYANGAQGVVAALNPVAQSCLGSREGLSLLRRGEVSGLNGVKVNGDRAVAGHHIKLRLGPLGLCRTFAAQTRHLSVMNGQHGRLEMRRIDLGRGFPPQGFELPQQGGARACQGRQKQAAAAGLVLVGWNLMFGGTDRVLDTGAQFVGILEQAGMSQQHAGTAP